MRIKFVYEVYVKLYHKIVSNTKVVILTTGINNTDEFFANLMRKAWLSKAMLIRIVMTAGFSGKPDSD